MPPDLLVGECSAEVLLDVDVQDRPELMVLAVRNESDQEDLSVGERERLIVIRDWSLITGRGVLQNGKIAGPKLFATPLLKSGNF